jgi:hypothetical protein
MGIQYHPDKIPRRPFTHNKKGRLKAAFFTAMTESDPALRGRI